MENKNKCPNYREWVKAKVWTIEQAAFLLNNLDPLQYDPLILRTGKVPRKLKDIQDTYNELRTAYRRQMGKTFYLIYPATVDTLAWENNLPYPEDLLVALYQHSYIDKPAEQVDEPLEATPEEESPEEYLANKRLKAYQKSPFKGEPQLTTRERQNFLKTIGLLVHMHLSQNNTPRYQRGDKINASQVANAIIEKARSLGIEIDGLKSLDRKITSALALLDEEVSQKTTA